MMDKDLAQQAAEQTDLEDALEEQMQATVATPQGQLLKLKRGKLPGEHIGAPMEKVNIIQMGSYPGERIGIYSVANPFDPPLWIGKPPKWLKLIVGGREYITGKAQWSKDIDTVAINGTYTAPRTVREPRKPKTRVGKLPFKPKGF